MLYIGELRAWQSARAIALFGREVSSGMSRGVLGGDIIELGIMSHRNLLVEHRVAPCWPLSGAD
jgi:hypothetical protein